MNFNSFYNHIVDTIPVNALCLIFVLLVALISLSGLYVYEMYIGRKIHSHNNEIIGIVFGAVSLIYSLVLAFVIVAVWDDYKDLNKTIASEIDKLNSIMAHSSALPHSIQAPIKSSLVSYCGQVLEKEWDMLQVSDTDRPSAIPDLRLMLLQLDAQNKLQENIYSVLDDDLSSISDLRRNRLSYSQSHVPDFVWFILKGGSIMLIMFYYFLHVPSHNQKRLCLLILSGYIAMCMFLVYSLDRPFPGRMQVNRLPYAKILTTLQQENLLTKNE